MGDERDVAGCDFGQELAKEVTKSRAFLKGVAWAAGILLAVAIAGMAFGVATQNEYADRRFREYAGQQSRLFHTTESEFRSMQTDSRENAREWAELKGRMSAQEALLKAQQESMREGFDRLFKRLETLTSH